MDDNEIVNMFFARQEDAIEICKRKYGQRLTRSAMNILHNGQDAEECVNDALFKAWEAIPPSRPEMLGAFLSKISRNLAINKWKSKNAARRGGSDTTIMLGELEDCIPTASHDKPEEMHAANQVTAAINACLNNMEKIMRMAFVLRYFHGESIASICARLDMSESKAKSMLLRARKRLKAHLEKEDITI